jgi:hypothetical protein
MGSALPRRGILYITSIGNINPLPNEPLRMAFMTLRA